MPQKISTIPLARYEPFYLISTNGEIIKRETGKQIQPIANPNGYLKVSLSDRENAQKQMLVHRLVAAHFIPNPYEHPMVNHKDGNKQNNFVGNLEWCTAQENVQHALKTGLTSGYMAFEDRCDLLDRVLAGEQVGDLAIETGRRPETLHKMLREVAKTKGIHDQWVAQMQENRRNAAIRNLEKNNFNRSARRC